MKTTISLCAVLAMAMAMIAMPSPGFGQEAARFIDIPAQPLAAALTELSEETGLQVTAPAALIDGQRGAAVSGELTPLQALSQLLQGTGLAVEDLGADGVVIVAGTEGRSDEGRILVLDTLSVTGLRDRTAQVGIFGEQNQLDIPYSVQSFSEEQIELVQPKSVIDVLELDPSVRSTVTSFGAGENYIIRGQNLFTSESLVDGLPGMVPGRRNTTAAYDRVELFKGPSSLLNGAPVNGNSAGLINYIPKKAQDVSFTRAGVDYESVSLFGTNVDTNHVFEDIAIRGFATVRGGQPGFDETDFSETVIGGSIGYFGDTVQVDLNLLYQEQDLTGGNPIIFPRNSFLLDPPDRNQNVFDDDLTYEHRVFTAIGGVQYQPADFVNLYAKGGFLKGRDEQLGGLFFIENDNGDGTAEPFLDFADTQNFALQSGADIDVTTGPVNHTFVIRGDYFNGSADFGGQSVASFSSNLYDPVSANIVNPGFGPATDFNDKTFWGVSFSDRLSVFDDRLTVTLGARYQRYNLSSSFNGTIKADELSPAASAVLRIHETWSVYASYIEGLGSPTLPTTGAANYPVALAPPVTEQIEVGTKYRGERFDVSLAVFQTTVPNRFLDPVTNIDDYNGENRYRGVEVIVDARPIDPLRVNAGVLFLDAEQLDTAGGLQDGFRPQASPSWSASLFTSYDVTDFATAFGRMIYTGSSFVDAREIYEVDANVRFDLGTTFDLEFDDRVVSMTAAVENVADTDDWIIGRNFVSQHRPRTFKLSLSTEF